MDGAAAVAKGQQEPRVAAAAVDLAGERLAGGDLFLIELQDQRGHRLLGSDDAVDFGAVARPAVSRP